METVFAAIRPGWTGSRNTTVHTFFSTVHRTDFQVAIIFISSWALGVAMVISCSDGARGRIRVRPACAYVTPLDHVVSMLLCRS